MSKRSTDVAVDLKRSNRCSSCIVPAVTPIGAKRDGTCSGRLRGTPSQPTVLV